MITYALYLQPGRSGEVIGSNPFMNPQPHNPTTSEPTASLSMQDAEKEEKDKKVTSRMTMNEEQRKIKEHFEEKQREEARRKAKQEKLAQKKVSLIENLITCHKYDHLEMCYDYVLLNFLPNASKISPFQNWYLHTIPLVNIFH